MLSMYHDIHTTYHIHIYTHLGKPKEVDERTTVYKRNAEKTYQLKRQVMGACACACACVLVCAHA